MRADEHIELFPTYFVQFALGGGTRRRSKRRRFWCFVVVVEKVCCRFERPVKLFENASCESFRVVDVLKIFIVKTRLRAQYVYNLERVVYMSNSERGAFRDVALGEKGELVVVRNGANARDGAIGDRAILEIARDKKTLKILASS